MLNILACCVTIYGLTISEAEVRRSLQLESKSITHQSRLDRASAYRIKFSSLRNNARTLSLSAKSCANTHEVGLTQALSEADLLYTALNVAKEESASSYFYVEFMVRVWVAYQEFDHIFDCQANMADMLKYSEYSL